MKETADLDTLCELLVHAPERGEAGEVLTDSDEWKVKERMWLGEVQRGGKPLNVANRDSADVELVYEGWLRSCVKEGVRIRLVETGETYTVNRVDPKTRQWMYVYMKAVK